MEFVCWHVRSSCAFLAWNRSYVEQVLDNPSHPSQRFENANDKTAHEKPQIVFASFEFCAPDLFDVI
jgi:hypothetical protein